MKTAVIELILCVITLVSSIECVCVNRTHFYMSGTSNSAIETRWFFNCTGGQHFNLSNNELTKVENSSFDTLWNVELLDLSNNKIAIIELETFAIMRRLERLYLDHNELTEIPMDFFKNKNNLISVDLSYNKITYIPLSVFNYSMWHIEEVILHHNQITAFEPWAYVKQAIRLDLRYNYVSTFTNDYNWTYISRTVYEGATTDLRHNNITEWHDWYLIQYKDTTSQDTGIESVLVELLPDIRENPFSCDCYAHNMIKRVRQSFFLWADSDYLNITCYNPPHLRGKRAFYDVAVSEFVCNITNDCPAGCLCQDRPEEGILNVDCQELNMTSIPDTLPRSPYDKIEVQLGHNEITQFGNVSYLEYITNLSMPDNVLTTLPDFVIDNIASKENAFIDFSNNLLTDVPSGAQNIKFQDAHFQGNNLECSCDMLWMVDWIKLAPRYADKTLNCTFEGKFYKIIDLNEGILKCNNVGSIILIVVLSLVLGIVIALLITAKRCPYETKVLLFKIFKIHPSDKYEVDKNTDKTFDMYVSFDDNDTYVRQWVMKVLFKQLKEKKPFYSLCVAARNAPPGPEADARLELIDKSRRLLIILSTDYDNHPWCQYELCHSETLEQNEGRIIYLLYDKNAEEIAKKEPWSSKMKGRKVFSLEEKMLWSKLRYELPRNPLPEPLMRRERPQEFANI
ncbi:protein toll-like [Mercenaria mercenaria]|uniref:protein toll-like n=1 Tax=Mercenaria mercenaria TaxID=6596 RepID=UPI00234F92E8|nr:protein toll-like [Mercenaria mercenaria]